MEHYSKYLEVIDDVYTRVKCLKDIDQKNIKNDFDKKEEEVTTSYNKKKESITSHTQQAIRHLMLDGAESVKNIKRTIEQLRVELKELQDKENSLKPEYEIATERAKQKSNKRAYVRSRIFKMWWSS